MAKSQDRDVEPFDTIELMDIVDVEVVDGAPVDKLVVTCDGNIIDRIDTRVSAGVLTVGVHGGSVSSSTECIVTTGNMDIVEIISLGIADITVQGPAWSLESIRSESIGNISVDLREARVQEEPEEEPLQEGTEESEGEEILDESEETGGDESDESLPVEGEEVAGEEESEGADESLPEEGEEVAGEEESADEQQPQTSQDGDEQADGQQPMPVVQADHLLIESTDLGDIDVRGLDRLSVDVRALGVGDISLEGEVDELDIEVIDLTEVRARSLIAEDVTIFADGVGDVTVTATQVVDIENRGIGTVTVYGDPEDRYVINDSVGDVFFR